MPSASAGHLRLLAIAIASILSLTIPASAQYFGQNKVQYHAFKFEVLKTDHFDIYYYPSEREGVDIAARLAERWHARLERLFDHELRGRQPLILYASHSDFEQTNVISGELTEGTGGVTEPLRRRIVLPMAGPIADTDHVIGHELVHAFQFDITARPGTAIGENGAERLPLWFIEGMAEYLSLGPVDANTAMWLRDAAAREQLPTIKDLSNSKYFPYRWGQAFWAYVGGRWGDRVVATMLRVAASTGDVDAAITRVLHITPSDLSRDWHTAIRETYAGALQKTGAGTEAAHLVVSGKEFGSELNVGPAISPDGRLIAFLSQRGFFAIDLYIAEASTGRVLHKLTSTATSPHYSSIQFVYSAGAWDRDGRRLAVAVVTGGVAGLAIFDAATGTRERDVKIQDVDEILYPTWAPDGHAIAFSAMTRGLTDLCVYDLSTGVLQRLTDDPYADLQPAWSPDGRRIAFVTDRFSTDLDSLAIGAYQLALLDPATGVIEWVPASSRGKHLDPQWSPDGQALYFVSDPMGIANVYRLVLATGDVTQVTNVATGVSGITSSSATLSVASAAGTLAFSVYQRGAYDIYTMATPAWGGPLVALPDNAAVLPPATRHASQVAESLSNATKGLPTPQQPYSTVPYRRTLSLESAGQPMIAVGVSRYGPAAVGGISLYFGDMLRYHQLATAVALNTGWTGSTSAKDIAAQAVYFNQSRRWNWVLIGAQIPYLSAGYQSTVSTLPNGNVLQSDRLITYRQTEQSAAAVVAYPFDRIRRVELQGGISHVSFDQIVDTTTYSLGTGDVYEQSTQTTQLARSLTLGTASAAYVFDTASFGATGPVRGQRYRLEVDPTFGTLNFAGVLADYRRYVMPVSFYTIAARLLHYGRYGSGGEDPRLYPLNVGYPGLVRGYDVTSVEPNECVATSTSSCPVIDRLLGSRMLVGNLEFRFPLLRPLGTSRNMYGPLPVEVAFFADSGVAWVSGERPSLFGGARNTVSSAGVTFRVNLLGFAIGEVDFVRPFQRPERGWIWSFNVLPGW